MPARSLRLLRLLPVLGTAALVHLLLLLYLGLIRYPWQRLRSPVGGQSPAMVVSAFCHAAVLILLAVAVVAGQRSAGPFQPLEVVNLVEEVDSPTLTDLPDAASSPQLHEVQLQPGGALSRT